MAKRIAFVLAVVLAVYLVFAGMRGFDLLASSNNSVKLLGLCVIILPILGAFLIYREIRFGYAMGDLGKAINPELLPSTDIKPRSPDAQAYLDEAIERTKADELNWQNWFSVSVGYDLTGQRKQARECMQHAVSIARN